MERWRDAEMERWRDGEMEKWRDGKREREREGERERVRVRLGKYGKCSTQRSSCAKMLLLRP